MPRLSSLRRLGGPRLVVGWAAAALLSAGSQTASAAVYDAPTSIPSDCSVAVDAQLNSWLASVPDGNTARLRPGGCYGHDGTVVLSRRSNFTLDGNGSTFRFVNRSARNSQLRIDHGTNVGVSNLTLHGTNQAHSWWDAQGLSYQHGLWAQGVRGLTVDGVRAYEVWGDGISLEPGYEPYCDDPNTDVTIRGSSTDHTGRNGLAIVFATNTLVVDSSFARNYGLALLDIEPDDPCWYVRGVTISRNTFDQRKNRAIQYHGLGEISGVTVTSDNVFKRR